MTPEEKDELLIRIDERTKNLDEKFDSCIATNADFERRLKVVEKWQWKATGVTAAITGFFGMVAGLFAGKGGI